MNINLLSNLRSHPALNFFGVANFIVFISIMSYYDAIERPNSIGYFALGLTVIASILYFLVTQHNSDEIIAFGFTFLFSVIVVAHNINCLIAFDYYEEYTIKSKRIDSAGVSEIWKVQLNDDSTIDMVVYQDSDQYKGHLDLKKGLFGVYFGNLRKDD